ncbi:MAG: hypothetical protein JXJ20_05985 [Anaerolineae bacterium]|nr:hypothetical protein [Anaerolineae bacterium]
MSETNTDLDRAYKLIKRDKIKDALSILRPIVQAEPDNPHTWWLLAYAAEDPREVREALVTVLRLDPSYSNAPKARDMLDKLNQQYPPEADELERFPELQTSFPDVFTEEFGAEEDLFEDEDFGRVAPFEEEVPAALFSDSAFDEDIEDELFTGEDPFADLQSDVFITEEAVSFDDLPEPSPAKDKRLVDLKRTLEELDGEPLDEETLAASEEREARRSGRGRRILRAFLLALVAVIVAFGITFVFISRGDSGKDDPGPLEAVDIESDVAVNSRSAAEKELLAANISKENEVVLARSDLGDTLFIEICGYTTPDLPQLIRQAADIASQQASSLQGELDAVGVAVNLCEAKAHDTLYRAVVSVDDAVKYLNGSIDWEDFQVRWKPA